MQKTWSQEEIEEIIKNFNTRQGGGIGGFSIPLHRHNGSDSNNIYSSDLLPYYIFNSVEADRDTMAVTNPAGTGQIQLFNFSDAAWTPGFTTYDWGVSLYLGNNGATGTQPVKVWSDIHMADFHLFMSQTTPQVIASGTNATIIFDGLPDDFSYPNGAYNTVTGLFSTITNQNGDIQAYDGWNSALAYIVTASVGVAADNGTVVPGESADINIFVDGNLRYWNRFYFPSATDPVILTLSVVMADKITDNIHIEVSNNTSDDLTTNIAGMEQITYFNIKQLK